ncbi:MAG TPA: N-6 DNA methylase [Terriglobia bacterium]|nr:N-6 DNA methylase [Terriglobia bacterium]
MLAKHLNPLSIGQLGLATQEAAARNTDLRLILAAALSLWAIVSLPAGVFNPYSGVKTSVLFLDRNLAKRMDEVLFVKVENDGFDLGAQRRPIGPNDLPEALKVLNDWRATLCHGRVEGATDATDFLSASSAGPCRLSGSGR